MPKNRKFSSKLRSQFSTKSLVPSLSTFWFIEAITLFFLKCICIWCIDGSTDIKLWVFMGFIDSIFGVLLLLGKKNTCAMSLHSLSVNELSQWLKKQLIKFQWNFLAFYHWNWALECDIEYSILQLNRVNNFWLRSWTHAMKNNSVKRKLGRVIINLTFNMHDDSYNVIPV